MRDGVLAQNSFKRLYESLGDKVRTRDIKIGGRPLEKLGYEWKDPDSLINTLMGCSGSAYFQTDRHLRSLARKLEGILHQSNSQGTIVV
jgi:hypothetical protein